MQQGFFDQGCNPLITQPASAMTCILVLGDALAKRGYGCGIVWKIVAPKQFFFPAVDHLFRQAVMQAKSDGLVQAWLIKVG